MNHPRLDELRAAFTRLNDREQRVVLAGGGAAMLLIFLIIGMVLSGLVSPAEHRLRVKTDQLMQVLQMQGEYRAREQARAARLRQLGGASVRLVSLVEDAARQAGVEIGQLRPEEGEPTSEGIVESRVDLRAGNLSADRLKDFLERLERTPGVVVIRRLKINRPYSKDTLSLEMTVTAYKMKS